jgi:hypothetical protein
MSRKGLTDVLTRVALEPDFRSRVHQDPSLLDALDSMAVDERKTPWFLAKSI